MREYLAWKCRVAEQEQARRRESVERIGYRVAVVFAGFVMGLGLPLVWLFTK